jgi:3-oxoacyl-[acyl-carrier-protein] synthase II
MAGISSIGSNWEEVEKRLRLRKNGIIRMDEWDIYEELQTRLAGPVTDFQAPPHFNRKKNRSMGRVSLLAVRSAEMALEDAGLLNDPEIQNGSMGVSYGSSTGSTDAIGHFAVMRFEKSMKKITATSYIQMMPHTTAVNIGLYFKLKGRIIPTSSACTSGSQGIGYAYEAIKYGMQTMMLAGGAEELCVTETAVFDILFATSTMNDHPETTPRPFDKTRDGLVIGEGAGTLILEELEHAKSRGAPIYAEVVGFGTNSDGAHVTQPTEETMCLALELSLKDAGLTPDAIGYINAHGTATEAGDIAETRATETLFGTRMPISSLKSYIGHTLGACGSLESWMTINMMNRDWYAPTINLNELDSRCGTLDYITGNGRVMQVEYTMNNNFAFGGINTSLIFKRPPC